MPASNHTTIVVITVRKRRFLYARGIPTPHFLPAAFLWNDSQSPFTISSEKGQKQKREKKNEEEKRKEEQEKKKEEDGGGEEEKGGRGE